MQFGINQHKSIFQRVTKLQFVVFEKFTSADLSQIAREKSSDYLLIMHIQKFYTASGCQSMLIGELPSFVNLDTAWNFKGLCHALSVAFILFLLYRYGLKSAPSIQACDLSSLRTVSKETPGLVVFIMFRQPLLCCRNVWKRLVAYLFDSLLKPWGISWLCKSRYCMEF